VGKVVEFVKDYGGMDYAASRAMQHVTQAKALISGFPQTPAKESLLGFADFVVQREK